ncbi:MAG TPA: hypothetical protein VHO01_06760 [Jatrophihabitans sp.]|nr:hypothetical protein [Jatrophihabitans sp.]
MLLAQSGTVATVGSALIGAMVTLGAAGIGWYAGARRDRGQREYDLRQSTLTEVQDAALALRQAMQDYGRLVRQQPNRQTAQLLDAQTAFDHARGALEVSLSRVGDEEVRRLILRWREVAQVTSISEQDEVTAQDEQRLWSALNTRIGRALNRRS